MAGPEDTLTFDPSRTPFTTPAPRFTYIRHPLVGNIKLNPDTKVVAPIPDVPYPNYPVRLPIELAEVDQPVIRTCSEPGPRNKGCDAAVNGGCPLIHKYGRGAGPFNMIVEKNGNVDSSPCFAVYCGITDAGRPTSQAHLLMDGWQILADRTTTEYVETKTENGIKTRRTVQMEVPELPPFYELAKVGRFAEAKPPKKRGRPKKVADAGA
jgi:hypothetical protein